MVKRLQQHIGYALYREQICFRRAFWDLLRSQSLGGRLAHDCLHARTVPPLCPNDPMALKMGGEGGSEFSKNQNEYVYRLRQSSVIEPDYGYVIARPFSVVDLSLPYADVVRSRKSMHVFSGLPSFTKFVCRIRRNIPVIRERSVISLRFPWEGNYYHCLQDSLGSLMLIDEVVADISIPIVIGRRLADAPFFRQLSRRGALAERRWIVQDQGYIEADEVIFALNSQGSRERFDRLLDGVKAPAARPDATSRIFLTRPPGKNSNGRYIRNIEEVSAVTQRYGFDQVDTSEMDIDEQMTIFSQARVVLGIHGAGLTNIIFRRGGELDLIEIFPPDNAPLHYYALAKAFGYGYDYLQGHSPSHRSGNASFELDVEVLEQKLRTIVSPVPVAVSGPI